MNDNSALRSVVWSEIFPWLSLVRSFRLAIRLRMLLLGAAAVALMLSGWGFFGLIFSSDVKVTSQLPAPRACPWLAATHLVPDQPGLPTRLHLASSGDLAYHTTEPVSGSWRQLTAPLGPRISLASRRS